MYIASIIYLPKLCFVVYILRQHSGAEQTLAASALPANASLYAVNALLGGGQIANFFSTHSLGGRATITQEGDSSYAFASAS
ncbi:MAG: hypothetical protein AB7P18_08445 [Candidatus Binatia bacterium]